MDSEKVFGAGLPPTCRNFGKKNPNFSIFGLKLRFFDSNGPTDPKNEFGTIKNFLEVHYYFFGSEKILGRAGHPHAGISAKKHPNFAVFGLKS